MAFILNEYDVREAAFLASTPTAQERPNLVKAVDILIRVVAWTNNNSDGWAYWKAPANATTNLQNLIYARFFGRYDQRIEEDITDEELKAALRPVKTFLTKYNIAHDNGVIAETNAWENN